MRTFVVGTTKIEVIAQISREELELDRLVLSRFEGSATTANAAFQTLVDRYSGRPLAEYALAPGEINHENRSRLIESALAVKQLVPAECAVC
jgi:hypothetical protein